MEEYRYILFKGRWGISITIYGQIRRKDRTDDECEEVYKGIWVKYSKTPLIEKELFCKEDRESIAIGIAYVGESILKHSEHMNNTLIEICSIQYCLSNFQQEGLPVAMMHWASNVFDFPLDEIKVEFDKEKKKYIFEY